MSIEQRAAQLMAKGPIWLVRRVMELEQDAASTHECAAAGCHERISLQRVVCDFHRGMVAATSSDSEASG